ncbi:SET and MYND domain-containing protein DDB_G0273589-like [Culex pipiens pallens]|uniref:SET and MYND domain-containing protein DDB_G0273589-like n=1 Tax=Culex pipiens pallens TaxID=42434 RepID=UPI001954077C|nr:SET and MYND domain-containing protein DDB_G0273589-like [Culex pipiens pallens]XP_039451252.1 SET and MYND domain-containing protein DDB_G0273589-like [Culex pipiens pallens]
MTLPNFPFKAIQDRWNLEMPRHRRNADISVYREFVARYDPLLSTTEVGKDNAKAVYHRKVGNFAYLEKRFDDALWSYNRSICFAENLSEHLGIGYANRSAIYYELGEYEVALYNIDLARKSNYPERLLPKLLAREANCKERLAGGHSKGTVPLPVVDINVDVNPKIPFMAKGIRMKEFGDMGRGLVAERDFKTGDVILDEKSDLCSLSFVRSFVECAHCGSAFLNSLIPCSLCFAVMYCGEKCREEDLRITHRFECSVVTKLLNVASDNMMMMPRLFFYGLTAFNDNIDQMMKYCLPNAAVGSNPLELDFTHPNPLDVFKVLHQAKPNRNNSNLEHNLKLSATAFYLVFMKNPLVQSIFRTEAQRNFMLRCLLIHGRATSSLLLGRENGDAGFLAALPPVASLINHSCDPNVISVVNSGRIKIIVLRPIQKGDQILTSYAPAWWDEHDGSTLDFDCKCVVCDRGPEGAKWRNAREKKRILSSEAMREWIGGGETQDLIKFQRLVQILARDGHHPGKLFGETVKIYYDKLFDEVCAENAKRNRAKVQQIGGNLF